MRVLVTGAYGLIGSACLARLHSAGHDVVGAGRSIATARRSLPYAHWIEADFAGLRDGVYTLAGIVTAIRDYVIRPWQHTAGALEAFAFKIPMPLAISFRLAILDER